MMCNIQEGAGTGMGSWFEDNIRKVAGNGRNNFFWMENWVGGVPLRFQFSCLYDLAVNKECSVEEMARLGWGEGGNAWGGGDVFWHGRRGV